MVEGTDSRMIKAYLFIIQLTLILSNGLISALSLYFLDVSVNISPRKYKVSFIRQTLPMDCVHEKGHALWPGSLHYERTQLKQSNSII